MDAAWLLLAIVAAGVTPVDAPVDHSAGNQRFGQSVADPQAGNASSAARSSIDADLLPRKHSESRELSSVVRRVVYQPISNAQLESGFSQATQQLNTAGQNLNQFGQTLQQGSADAQRAFATTQQQFTEPGFLTQSTEPRRSIGGELREGASRLLGRAKDALGKTGEAIGGTARNLRDALPGRRNQTNAATQAAITNPGVFQPFNYQNAPATTGFTTGPASTTATGPLNSAPFNSAPFNSTTNPQPTNPQATTGSFTNLPATQGSGSVSLPQNGLPTTGLPANPQLANGQPPTGPFTTGLPSASNPSGGFTNPSLSTPDLTALTPVRPPVISSNPAAIGSGAFATNQQPLPQIPPQTEIPPQTPLFTSNQQDNFGNQSFGNDPQTIGDRYNAGGFGTPGAAAVISVNDHPAAGFGAPLPTQTSQQNTSALPPLTNQNFAAPQPTPYGQTVARPQAPFAQQDPYAPQPLIAGPGADQFAQPGYPNPAPPLAPPGGFVNTQQQTANGTLVTNAGLQGVLPPGDSRDEREPWTQLVFATVVALGSVGGNLFLGWSYLDARNKYRTALRRASRTFEVGNS